MATSMSRPGTVTGSPTNQVTRMHEIVKTIREDSLRDAQAKVSPLYRGAELEELFQSPEFLDNFKYSVAEGVSSVIAAHDSNALATYLFDPSSNPDLESGEFLPMDATVHLLLLVKSPSAGLNAFITSLDRALLECLKVLPSAMFAQLSSILDIIPITKNDVEKKRGYATLLKSIFAPPLRIWKRD